MALTKQANGSNTTVSFSYTAATAKVNDTLTDAAHNLFNRGVWGSQTFQEDTAWDSLTNLQQATILDDFIKQVLRDQAKDYNLQSSLQSAREKTNTINETKYI